MQLTTKVPDLLFMWVSSNRCLRRAPALTLRLRESRPGYYYLILTVDYHPITVRDGCVAAFMCLYKAFVVSHLLL